MGRRFSATIGFAVGLGTASLLNLDFYSAIAGRAIASSELFLGPVETAQPNAFQAFTPGKSCANSGSSINSLRSPHSQNISLLKHVPTLPQRLNWYGITQESAIANAPRAERPKPAITQWSNIQAEIFSSVEPCGTPPAQLAQVRPFTLQQQAYFILSLASLNPKNDWLLQPQPQPPQPIHVVWRDQAPMEVKLASQS